MDLKPALIKKLSDMQKGLSPEESDFETLESLKNRVSGENDQLVISKMVLILNEIISGMQGTESGKEAASSQP